MTEIADLEISLGGEYILDKSKLVVTATFTVDGKKGYCRSYLSKHLCNDPNLVREIMIRGTENWVNNHN